MLNFETADARVANERYGSGLGHSYNAAKSQRLGNSRSRPLIQSASNNYAQFIREKNYANELALGERNIRYESP